MKNYYEVLGVAECATESEIKSAYRKLAKQYHPDTHPGNMECEKKFREINEAYDTLSDSAKRKHYDEEHIGKGVNNSSKDKKEEFRKKQSTNVDFENVYKSFEQFFGFNPYTQDVMNEEKLNPKGVNPLDTTEMFERFMGIK